MKQKRELFEIHKSDYKNGGYFVQVELGRVHFRLRKNAVRFSEDYKSIIEISRKFWKRGCCTADIYLPIAEGK